MLPIIPFVLLAAKTTATALTASELFTAGAAAAVVVSQKKNKNSKVKN